MRAGIIVCWRSSREPRRGDLPPGNSSVCTSANVLTRRPKARWRFSVAAVANLCSQWASWLLGWCANRVRVTRPGTNLTATRGPLVAFEICRLAWQSTRDIFHGAAPMCPVCIRRERRKKLRSTLSRIARAAGVPRCDTHVSFWCTSKSNFVCGEPLLRVLAARKLLHFPLSNVLG